MRIDLAGYGPGSSDLTTLQVRQALEEAELIITSERLAGYVRSLNRTDSARSREILVETRSSEICRILEDTALDKAVCLFGGDSSFYSGAAPLLTCIGQSRLLRDKDADIRILPGISSLSYACSCLGLSLREVEVFSAHGRSCDPVRAVMNGKKSFFLTGGDSTSAKLCGELTRAGLGALKVTVMENLSAANERIRQMTAAQAAGETFDPLSVLIADAAYVSDELRRGVPGIPDAAFARGKVPMTKRLVRVSALSLLNPSMEDLCWDLGAGTGSVSVELSARCRRVISVERNPEAAALMEENRKRFGAWNMEIVTGEIPEILRELPAPDRIFLGGGGRWIRSVLDAAHEKCAQDSRLPAVLATAITLETLQEAVSALEAYGYETGIVQAAVTDIRKQGQFHMMNAQNPVFLILGEAGGKNDTGNL